MLKSFYFPGQLLTTMVHVFYILLCLIIVRRRVNCVRRSVVNCSDDNCIASDNNITSNYTPGFRGLAMLGSERMHAT